MATSQLAHVSHGQFSYGLVIERGKVTDAPPAGRWAVGMSWPQVAAKLRERRAAVAWDPPRVRMIITGSRQWPDPGAVWDFLAGAYAEVHGRAGLTIVHGACGRGADKAAAQYAAWAVAQGLDVLEETWPADWAEWGKRAGMMRNKDMVAAGAGGCGAFILDASPGATGCAHAAADAGIPVVLHERWTSPWARMWDEHLDAVADGRTGPLIEARYDGRCRACANRWEPGDAICFDEDEGAWICAGCAGQQS